VHFLNGLGRFLLAAKNKIFLYEADDDDDDDDNDKGYNSGDDSMCACV